MKLVVKDILFFSLIAVTATFLVYLARKGFDLPVSWLSMGMVSAIVYATLINVHLTYENVTNMDALRKASREFIHGHLPIGTYVVSWFVWVSLFALFFDSHQISSDPGIALFQNTLLDYVLPFITTYYLMAMFVFMIDLGISSLFIKLFKAFTFTGFVLWLAGEYGVTAKEFALNDPATAIAYGVATITALATILIAGSVRFFPNYSVTGSMGSKASSCKGESSMPPSVYHARKINSSSLSNHSQDD